MQLFEILSAVRPRGKVSISFMAFSGLRPETLGDKEGTAGLVLGDLPDLDIGSLSFKSIPAQVIVRREISKAHHQYFTFLCEKGVTYLLNYLKERMESGQKLNLQSLVIRANWEIKKRVLKGLGRTADSFFVCSQNVEDEVRCAIGRAGYSWRPYVLRSYFDSHLLNVEFRGSMSATARAFFMDHVGDIERKYTLDLLRDKICSKKVVFRVQFLMLFEGKAASSTHVSCSKLRDSSGFLITQ